MYSRKSDELMYVSPAAAPVGCVVTGHRRPGIDAVDPSVSFPVITPPMSWRNE